MCGGEFEKNSGLAPKISKKSSMNKKDEI